MKCDVCKKEISEEESYKGCCKDCASKIFDKIETKHNVKDNIINQLNLEEKGKNNNTQFIQKDDLENEYYTNNKVASSIATTNDIIFVIAILISIFL